MARFLFSAGGGIPSRAGTPSTAILLDTTCTATKIATLLRTWPAGT